MMDLLTPRQLDRRIRRSARSGRSRCRRRSTPPRSPAPAAARRRRSRPRCWISASSPGWATSTSARRCTSPASRRSGRRRRSRRVRRADARGAAASPRRSSRCSKKRSRGKEKARYRVRAIPRLRPRRRARARAAAAPAIDRAADAGRPQQLLLPGVPAMSGIVIADGMQRLIAATAVDGARRGRRRRWDSSPSGRWPAASAIPRSNTTRGRRTISSPSSNRRVEDGTAHLDFDEGSGYLRPVLDALHVPPRRRCW